MTCLTDNPELFDASWAAICAEVRESADRLRSLSHAFHVQNGEYDISLLGFDPSPEGTLKTAAQNTVAKLCSLAGRRFGAPGMPAPVNHDAMEHHWRPLIAKDLDGFRPSAVWAMLSEQYGGDKGREKALIKSGNVLVRYFGLHHQPERKRRRNRTLLSRMSYAEAGFRGGLHLSYNHSESVREASPAWRAFCDWAGIDGDVVDLFADIDKRFGYHEGSFTSRDRVEAGPITVIIYNSKLEFLIPDDIADALSDFCDQHSTWLREQMAA